MAVMLLLAEASENLHVPGISCLLTFGESVKAEQSGLEFLSPTRMHKLHPDSTYSSDKDLRVKSQKWGRAKIVASIQFTCSKAGNEPLDNSLDNFWSVPYWMMNGIWNAWRLFAANAH